MKHKTLALTTYSLWVFSLLLGVVVTSVQASSGTWLANPINGDWNTAANWSPNSVPNSPSDTASFAVSNRTAVSLSAPVVVDGITFSAGASSYTITSSAAQSLAFAGIGVTNNSAILQNFATAVSRISSSGLVTFSGSATAGSGTAFTNNGAIAQGASGGVTDFFDASTAANSTLINNGGQVKSALGATTEFFGTSTAGNAIITNFAATSKPFATGGKTKFFNASTAGTGTFTNKAGTIPIANGSESIIEFHDSASAAQGTFTNESTEGDGADAGLILFLDSSTAEDGTFMNNAATNDGDSGGSGYIGFGGTSSAGHATFFNGASNAGGVGANITFSDDSTAGTATITNEGAGIGAEVNFTVRSTAGDATLIANAGAGTGFFAAHIDFLSDSSGGTARVQVFGSGNIDISFHNPPGLAVGSVEGDGVLYLGGINLMIGTNNLSTTFSGSAVDGGFVFSTGGSLTKIGTGTLTLSGESSYTGGTTVSAGALLVSNTTGSGTGTESVAVNGGTLGGSGIIAGAVTVGTGSGTGATLQPSFGTTRKVALTIQSLLTFKADATYTFRLKSRTPEVIANGVTIESGAQFNLLAPNRQLPTGKTATVISNTAATPIAGTFANLPDGGTITVGNNTFQANYEGGNGNDLTLTVLP